MTSLQSVSIYLGCYHAKLQGVRLASNPLSSIKDTKAVKNGNVFKVELPAVKMINFTGIINLNELLEFEFDKPMCQINKLTAFSDSARTNPLSVSQLPTYLDGNPVSQVKATGFIAM